MAMRHHLPLATPIDGHSRGKAKLLHCAAFRVSSLRRWPRQTIPVVADGISAAPSAVRINLLFVSS
jgi:hypothetical protein